jgi:hypothetical protein
MDEALWLVKSFAVLRMTKAKALAIGNTSSLLIGALLHC